MNPENNTAIIILAAGTSFRMGKPKQLLKYRGKSLLRHAVDEAADVNAGVVAVVLGANAEVLQNEIRESNIRIIINQEWQEGMASSIRCGLHALITSNPITGSVLLMVCDQPHVSANLLKEIIQTQKETGKPIVACNYGNTLGTPALFSQKYFPELLQLRGDEGAKKIIQQHGEERAIVFFPGGTIDIDTPADYNRLQDD